MTTAKKCPACGGTMFFDPGWNRLVCQYCGTKKDIDELYEDPAEEISISSARALASRNWGVDTRNIRCAQCGAVTVNDALQLAGCCPFCGSATVVPAENDNEQLAPNAVIPFVVSKAHAEMYFKQWISKRSMAPSDIRDGSKIGDFQGVYIPYWTFDVNTAVSYQGKFGYERGSGDNRYIKYYKKEGSFQKFVDDYPIAGSWRAINDPFIKKVSQYNTGEARPYTSEALAGFVAEQYSIGLEDAWKQARQGILHNLELQIKNNEAADVVSNLKYNYQFSNIKFKYVLVPVWLSSYTYRGKPYRIAINGQTGEVFGNWPRSFKILFIILGIIGGATMLLLFMMMIARGFGR
ncbi:MAG: hypothetical protein IKH76_01430 [Clostridiales bacterium]|nr:hypothetical protein [Clostridiales bacterium]